MEFFFFCPGVLNHEYVVSSRSAESDFSRWTARRVLFIESYFGWRRTDKEVLYNTSQSRNGQFSFHVNNGALLHGGILYFFLKVLFLFIFFSSNFNLSFVYRPPTLTMVVISPSLNLTVFYFSVFFVLSLLTLKLLRIFSLHLYKEGEGAEMGKGRERAQRVTGERVTGIRTPSLPCSRMLLFH